MLEEFDRYVFESIVEKVIVGGYDEEGNKDPELITFIYKSGFKDSLTAHDFRSPRKSYAARKESYHSSEYEGEDVYQKGGGDTCRRYKCVDGVFVKSGAGGIGQKRLVGIIKAGIDYCYEHSLSVKFHGVVEI